MDKSTGPPGPHHAHRTCSAVESTAMKLSAHTASADVNVRGVWTLIEVMYLVNPLCTGCEPLWFLNTRTLQSHLQLIVEYLGHCTGIQWAVYEAWKEKRLHVFRLWWPGRLTTFTDNSVSSLEPAVLSQPLVKAECTARSWILYTMGLKTPKFKH